MQEKVEKSILRDNLFLQKLLQSVIMLTYLAVIAFLGMRLPSNKWDHISQYILSFSKNKKKQLNVSRILSK